MKKIFYIPLLILGLFLTSCNDFGDTNIDPTVPADADLELVLPGLLAQSAFNEGNNACRVAGIVTQQFFGLDAQQLAYNTYVLGQDVMNNYWNFGLYAGVLRSCQVVIDKAAEEGRPIYGAIAQIIMANEYGKATAAFGDIPMSEAMQGTGNLTPSYDSQENVYAQIQSMLDEAISTLSDPDLAEDPQPSGDLIFGGDASLWVSTAKAMKARYMLHTAKRTGDYAGAAAMAADAIASNSMNPTFQFENTATANHSLAKFAIERPSTLGIDPRFAAMMDGDPRQSYYMFEDDAGWQWFDMASGGNTVWSQSAARIPLITYVEMLFIQAEAAARAGDGSDFLQKAMFASMELVGIAPADVDSSFVMSASSNGSLENVMTEAYKAYYGFNFHETWANWRRTGFPALTPTADASNGFNPSGAIPQRYLYAESEATTNRLNVEAAQNAQNGALLDVPVWAFE